MLFLTLLCLVVKVLQCWWGVAKQALVLVVLALHRLPLLANLLQLLWVLLELNKCKVDGLCGVQHRLGTDSCTTYTSKRPLVWGYWASSSL